MIKKEFALILAAIQTGYNTKFSLEKANLYFDNLKDIDYKNCEQAVKKLLQTEEYPPTIAAIRKACLAITSGDKPSLEETMTDLRKMVSRYGRYNTESGYKWLKDHNPTAYRIMRALGYEAYANNQASYMQPTISKLHKEIVENNADVLLLQDKFAQDIGKIKTKALAMNGDVDEW